MVKFSKPSDSQIVFLLIVLIVIYLLLNKREKKIMPPILWHFENLHNLHKIVLNKNSILRC